MDKLRTDELGECPNFVCMCVKVCHVDRGQTEVIAENNVEEHSFFIDLTACPITW